MATYRNVSDIELVFQNANGAWTEPRCGIDHVEGPLNQTIVVKQPCWDNLHIPQTNTTTDSKLNNPKDNPMGGFNGISPITNPNAIENVYEDLKNPGEFYLDEHDNGGTLYYLPRPGEDPRSKKTAVIVPRLETLVEATGTLDQPVENLEFRGITFSDSTWLRPSGPEGFAEMQANVTLTGEGASGTDTDCRDGPCVPEGTCAHSTPAGTCPFAAWTKEPAAVTFHSADHVVFADDTFTHLGSAGLNFDRGSQGDVVEGNDFTDISGNGIQLGDTDERSALAHGINSGSRIVDNYVHHTGVEYRGAVGIFVTYAQDTLIAHNQVYDLPYTGISFGWGGWHTDSLHPDTTDNISVLAANEISDNLIFRVMQTQGDGGAIYTNGEQHGLGISGNIAYVAPLSEFIYYNDEGSSDITLTANVEYRATALANGGCSTEGRILITGNYWAQAFGGYPCPPPPVGVNVADHHVISDHPGPGDIPTDILAAAGPEEPAPGPPLVTGLGPEGGPECMQVLISGSGFVGGGTQVSFRGVPSESVRVLSSGYLVATVPPGVVGTVDVVVTTWAGSSATSTDDLFVAL